ncbi:sensor domain-containing diguanylate cyclase [Pseudidiomarina aquimaris]|nr:GGDEF domain-containing protein [Pseudidiomarina aquimaris]
MHLPTLIITTITLNVLLAGVMFIIYQVRRSQKSFLTWALACAVFAVAVMLTSMRAIVDDQPWLTVFMADLCIIFAPLLALHGLRQYQVQGPVSLKLVALVMSYSALPLVYLYTSPLHAQTLTAVITAAIYLFAAAYMLTIKQAPALSRNVLFLLFLLHGALMLGMAGMLFQNLGAKQLITVEPILKLILITHLLLTTGTVTLFPVFAFAMSERRLLEIVNFDELTQLYNRRAFFERGSMLLAKNRVLRRPFCVLMLDLDHFKEINDRFGHAAGDACLREVARIIHESVRDNDVAARIGGEEFALALSDVDRNQAELLSYRLCQRIAQQVFEHNDEKIELTVSIGGIFSISSRRELSDLLNAADSALYEAKAGGRNQFKFA